MSIDFKGLAENIGKMGLTALSSGLLGPQAAVVGALINGVLGLKHDATPVETQAALIAQPDALLKLTQLQNSHSEFLAQLDQQQDIEELKAINETMRVELQNSKDETWYQKGWRPFNGYVVGLGSFVGVIGAIWLLYQGVAMNHPEAVQAVPGLAFALATILSVPGAAVGITAWHRGKLQREKVAQ